ncbi:BCCT family transporter [Streptomyces halobius]|uniref:BCCT family transporter n=1 Tax=Streptomyces halobius TaxID=2879846 RepID=A0ABY4M2E6_9ACTN|nr:BCCT family transporter [Streptomyces halobius]UQA91917.1 BCCT family transporter [Streptomyces halobius]
MASPPSDEKRVGSADPSIAKWVFIPAALIILAFVVYATAATDNATAVISKVNEQVVGSVGWYYTAIVALFVVFALWVGIGHFGDIKLGKNEDKAEFGLGSWLAMLFAAGMGIGLVFWGVAEPLTHFAAPRPGTGEGSAAQAQASLVQTFMHWGIHPWAIYVVVGLSVAYAVHRKGRPVSIRWALEPLLGDRVKGGLGNAIDIVAIVGTLFGVATSLGLGVMQISSGLDFLGWVDEPSTSLQVVLILCITAAAAVSVVTGVKKGIKWLSNANMGLAAALMIFVLIAGPTLFLLNEFVTDIGAYLQNLLRLSFDTGAMQGQEGEDWQSGWTTFYWGWWISWAPFVGIFIARISRGRTVREFVLGVMLVPTLLTFFWFAVFGGAGLHLEMFGDGGIVDKENGVDKNSALFQLLDTLPGGAFIAGVAILLIVLFFVTSSDSGSYVVDMLASGGDPNPPVWSRVFWAVLEGAVAIALIVAGGSESLGALQTMAILIALPFSFIMLGMCYSTIKEFRRERARYLAHQRRIQTEELTDKVVAAIDAVNGDGDGGSRAKTL